MTKRVHRIPHRDTPTISLAVDEFAPDGPPRTSAIFLPGFGSVRRGEKATRFGTALPRDGIRFLSLDFQGLGDSEGHFGSLTLRRQISDYRSARDHMLARERHIVIGSSMGGLVGAMAAADDPEHVAGLVLIAPAFGFRERFEKRLGAQALAYWERTNRLDYKGEGFQVALEFQLLKEAREIDELALVRSLRQPVLLFHGDQDQSVPIEESDKIAAEIRSPLEYVRFAGGSHRLENHIDEMTAAIRAFAARVTST